MRLLCRVAQATGWDALHSWKKGRRGGGFLRRRCRGCSARQMRVSGKWLLVEPVKRVRTRKHLHLQTPPEEERQDAAQGLLP